MTVETSMVVGLGTNERWSSRMVRRATRSWCSHAWLETGFFVIHAQPEGVVRQSIFEVLDRYPVYRRFEIRGIDRREVDEAADYASSLLGRPYDWGVIENALRLVWWRLTGHVLAPARNPYELHCSELVSLVLRRLEGVQWTDQLDPEPVHPGKLFAFVDGHPDFTEIS